MCFLSSTTTGGKVLLLDRQASQRQGAIPATGWMYRQRTVKGDPSTHTWPVMTLFDTLPYITPYSNLPPTLS